MRTREIILYVDVIVSCARAALPPAHINCTQSIITTLCNKCTDIIKYVQFIIMLLKIYIGAIMLLILCKFQTLSLFNYAKYLNDVNLVIP